MAEMFGPYRLLGLIGRGAMGEVHRAYDTVRQRVVALKRLSPALTDDDAFHQRFRRESEHAARLREAHVVPIHDFGEIDGVLYIDMRLVDGVDLRKTLAAEGPFEPERAVRIIIQIGQALDAAHEEGLVHRDVKPSNVLINGKDFAYLIDFGLVRTVLDSSSDTSGAIGTPAYMAPERFLGRGGVDPGIDVYALGCMLFELLTGEQPFPAGEPAVVMYAHLSKPVPRPSQRRPGVPAAFDDVVARAMAKESADRFPSAGDLAGAAQAALAEPATVPARPRTVPQPARPSGLVHPSASRQLSGPAQQSGPPGIAHPSFPRPLDGLPGAPPARGPVPSWPGPPARPRRHRRLGTALAAVLLVSGLATGVGMWVTGPGAALTTSGSVPVGRSPVGFALTRDGSLAYVANALDDSVSVIDVQRADVVATLPVGRSPRDVVVSPDGSSLYVTAAGQDALVTVDAATGAVRSTVAVGDNPVGLAIAPDGRVYTADEFDDTVSVVDPVAGEVLATVPVGAAPIGVVVAPDGRSVYVTTKLDDTVTIVETSTFRRTGTVFVGQPEIAELRDVPRGLQRVAFTPDGSRAWFLVGGSRSISVVDTRLGTVVDKIALTDFPAALAFSADGSHAFVANGQANTLIVIDIASRAVVGTVPVGTGPVRLVVAHDGRQAYVVNRDGATVSIVDVRL